MISYVAYCRDSGGQDQDLSISQQETALTAWASSNDAVITRWFKDAARPGSSIIGREAFQDMMSYFRGGAPESGLVVWKMSRFAREINDSQFHRADLRRRGYKVISINDPVPEGPEGIFFEAAIDWMNSRFIADLSRDVKRGLSDLVKTYGAVPGTPPRGFIRQPVELPDRRDGRPHLVHRWVPDSAMIPIIRQAFELRQAGKSLFEINKATHLYGSLNSYRTFFSNRLYIGILDFGDQAIENYCEPMIPLETWEAVQAIIAKRANHINQAEGNPAQSRRQNSNYLLSGLVFCARCGSPLFGYASGRSNKTHFDRYACTRAVRRRDCDFRPIPRKVLESLVIETLRTRILTLANLVALQDLVRDDEQDHRSHIEEERKAAASRLSATVRKIGNVTESIADGGSSRALLDKLKTLESEEGLYRSQLADLERQAATPYIPVDLTQMEAIIKRLLEHEPRALLEQFITRVTVDREEAKIIGQIIYRPP